MWSTLMMLAALLGPPPISGPLVAPARVPPADRTCQEPGTPAREIPWHQRSYDPQRIAPLTRGEGITVAVLDSGVDASHPQLAGRVLAGQDLLFGGGGPGNWDCVGHGTAVASLIAGAGDGEGAFRGYAPAAQVLPLVVSERSVDQGEGTAGSAEGFAAAIRAAVAAHAQVINVSLVLDEDHPSLRAAVEQALANDIVVVAAVGHADQDSAVPTRTPYPAGYPGVIGVGSIDMRGARPASSPAGPWVDLVAPGDQVLAATRSSGFTVYQGTSFATPFVSAAAALVLASEPDLSARQVAARLFATADPAAGGLPGGRPSAGYGWGVVNAYRAVSEHQGSATRDAAQPLPVFTSDPVDPVRTRQIRIALTASALIGGLAALAVAAASAVPKGRR
ncbi:MAG: S8 family serine peptidase, partial [Dactylosporangium sp.]|nr:S8 family serine peptidase [Dactylosporangium sp.]NNJ60779.1 S8 family serine peptidase [Dactylosporangium sp.]